MSERSSRVNLSFKAFTLDETLDQARNTATELREKVKQSYKTNCKVLDDAIKQMDAEFSDVFPEGSESAPMKLAAQVQQMEDKRQLIALLSCNQLNNIEQHISIQLRDMLLDAKESNGLLPPRKIDEPGVKQEKDTNKIMKGTLEAVGQPTTPPCSAESPVPPVRKKETKETVKPAARKAEKKRPSFTMGIQKIRDNLKTRRAEKKRKEASTKKKEMQKESEQSNDDKPKNRVQLLRKQKSVNITSGTTKTPSNLKCTTPESSAKQLEEGNNTVAHTPPLPSSPKKSDGKKNAKPWYQLW